MIQRNKCVGICRGYGERCGMTMRWNIRTVLFTDTMYDSVKALTEGSTRGRAMSMSIVRCGDFSLRLRALFDPFLLLIHRRNFLARRLVQNYQLVCGWEQPCSVVRQPK